MRKIDWILIVYGIGIAFLFWFTGNLIYEMGKFRNVNKRIEALELIEMRVESKLAHLPHNHRNVETMRDQ